MDKIKKLILEAQELQMTIDGETLPHPIIGHSRSNLVIDRYLLTNTRGYIEKVGSQINITYESGCYDACAVMVRRLVETLIIEMFESRSIAYKIKNPNGEFYYLKDLIIFCTAESVWNLSRNSRRSLDKLKDVGDKSAHNRYFNAQRRDIDNIKSDLRGSSQEALYISRIKN